MVFKKGNFLIVSIVTLLLAYFGLCSIALGVESDDLSPSKKTETTSDRLEPPVKTDWNTGTYGPTMMSTSSEEVTPFGSYLFSGGFRGVRADGLNPTYRIAPGDQVTLRIWGLVDIDRVMPVDAQGNIFIPSVGPVKVQGITHSELDSTVRRAVKTIYPENVYVYTNLQGVQPVGVFVTGYVKSPGRYAGTPNDSLLYFLDQAGGIDRILGSYRKIKIIRNGETIDFVDLYGFLLSGTLPRPQFREGDTIIVAERGATVTVGGEVDRLYRYELFLNELQGREILKLARLQADASHVLLRGIRSIGPISVYYPLDKFSSAVLQDGDDVVFSADQRKESIVIKIEGSFIGPSRYVLPKDATLLELLDAIEVPEMLTDVNSISVRRKSIADRQKSSLKESLRRLETTYLGAPSSTPEEAQIRVREAELIKSFVERASKVTPNGRLVVSQNGNISNIRLQDGDVITIPERSDSLLVSGEVILAQSFVYSYGTNVNEYIRKSGGFTQHADKKRILIVRQSGEISDSFKVKLRAGDEILVLPVVPTKNLQLATSISQILYQIAIAAKVAIDL